MSKEQLDNNQEQVNQEQVLVQEDPNIVDNNQADQNQGDAVKQDDNVEQNQLDANNQEQVLVQEVNPLVSANPLDKILAAIDSEKKQIITQISDTIETVKIQFINLWTQEQNKIISNQNDIKQDDQQNADNFNLQQGDNDVPLINDNQQTDII